MVTGNQTSGFAITELRPEHWLDVRDIYAAGIATGNATFETTVPLWADWDSNHLAEHRLVALGPAGNVLGWTAVSRVSSREVYAGVVEHGIYIHPEHRNEGLGRQLLGALIESTESAGVWTIQTGIFPENYASLALHRRLGFRTVGRRERIGQLDGHWRDVILLERRSNF